MLMTVGIFSVVKFLGLLRRAVQGHLPVDGLGMILTFKLATFLDVILTPAVYIAIMLMLMRWSRDNEITIYATGGVGPLTYLLPAGFVAAGAAFIVAILSLYIAPAAELGYQHELDKYRLTTKSAPFKKGEFRKLNRRGDVLYYSHIPEDENDPVRLFYFRTTGNEQSIIVAQQGSYEFSLTDAIEELKIQDGFQYWIDLDGLSFQETEFETFTERIPSMALSESPISPKAKPTARLLRSNDLSDKAELNWRLSKVLAMALVVVLAFAWGTAAARSRLSVNLVGAVVVYFVYSSLVGFTTDLLRAGQISTGWVSTLPHLGLIAVIVMIYVRSYYNRSISSVIRLRRF